MSKVSACAHTYTHIHTDTLIKSHCIECVHLVNKCVFHTFLCILAYYNNSNIISAS